MNRWHLLINSVAALLESSSLIVSVGVIHQLASRATWPVLDGESFIQLFYLDNKQVDVSLIRLSRGANVNEIYRSLYWVYI
jgi:hypothetical protein